MTKRWMALVAVIAAALTLGFGMVGQATAQGTPESTPGGGMAMNMEGHPAHIHNGTCATLGDIAWPLNNLTAGGAMATPEMDMMGASTPMAGDMGDMGMMGEAEGSTTVVDVSLDDILNGEHAINVHESVENIQNYIACGDLTGSPTDGTLTIQLNELNGSGYTGTATLKDNGDGTTTVEVWVKQGAATPASSPAA